MGESIRSFVNDEAPSLEEWRAVEGGRELDLRRECGANDIHTSHSHPRLGCGTLSLFIRLAFLLLIVDGDDGEVCEPEEAFSWFGRLGRLVAGGCV